MEEKKKVSMGICYKCKTKVVVVKDAKGQERCYTCGSTLVRRILE
jgi:ribosomal protein S27E